MNGIVDSSFPHLGCWSIVGHAKLLMVQIEAILLSSFDTRELDVPNATTITTIPARTPRAVLDFWLGPMRSEADASRDNWRDRMLKWRVGPFARSAEDKGFFNAQRDWCEQIHREGIDPFFSDPVWETPKGLLAKLIVLDQFPRCVYRGTPAAYANDSITGALATQLCTANRDLTEYNAIERFWVYVPLSHPEELELLEMGVRKVVRWSEDLVGAVSLGRRKINQFISWYFIKAFIEHSDCLLIFGRFPHRNAILGREHKSGEPRYLNNPVRPLWSFTQPPQPQYFAILGALHRIEEGLDENRIRPETLAELQRTANLPLDGPDTLMDVFDLSHNDAVSYMTLYRHMILPQNERAFSAICRTPVVADDLFQRIKCLILKDPEDPWPPKSAMHSVRKVIDVAAMRGIVSDTPPPPAYVHKPLKIEVNDRPQTRSLVLKNDSSEIERLASEVNSLAERYKFAEQAVFEIQLALEEWVMNTINHGFNDAAEHEIHVDLEFQDDARTFAVHVADDGRQFDPLAQPLELDYEAFLADRVEGGGVGLQLVLKFADDVKYSRRGAWNHMTLIKRV